MPKAVRFAAMSAMAELPAGDGPDGRHAAVLGGFGLAVSRYSRQPDLAVDLVRWLTSVDEQKRRASEGAFDPSRPALYEDPELLAKRPYYPALRPAMETAVIRPASDRPGCVRCGQPGLRRPRSTRSWRARPSLRLASSQLSAALRRLGPVQRWGS